MANRIVNNRRSFTMVELLIVISLMGVLAALVLPRFEPTLHDQLDAGWSILAADLAYARSLAVTNQSRYRIDFDIDANVYTLHHTGPNPSLDVLPPSPFHASGGASAQQITRLDELPHLGTAVRLAAVYRLTPSAEQVDHVEFGPLGATTRSEQTEVWLACGNGAGTRYLTLLVQPTTGLVTFGEFGDAPPPHLGSAGG